MTTTNTFHKSSHKKINRLLIANRGEIAVRIMQSAQKNGIHCIALYSDADKNAMHVKQANEAWYIGASPAKESYLQVDKILQVAKDANADAIHPGYGFLSENALFAQAIQTAGMIWVGPPVLAIEAMGSKSESKTLMEKANVPLVPGYHGDNQDEAFLSEQIKSIGFPVLIKASAGGGGKGMRVVENESQIAAGITASKREGLNSFGDDKLLVEKYITRPRHVEIQIFMDQQGNGVYLFERDCSIQRRHQKVVEEAPAPQFNELDRTAMGEAALQAAKAIAYQGAGTVEFLYEPASRQDERGTFYFMEMNTRLQVEHPVTEMITGLDLVIWQIKVAQGETLPLSQDQLSINGHSMEVRIYAEDPDNEFLPTTGSLDFVQLPQLEEGRVRLDTGVKQGDDVSPYYDPMISKLIVWGEDRQQCLSTLKQALQEYQIAGVTTNLSFLRRVVNVEAFKQGLVSTQFIEEFSQQLMTAEDVKQHHLLAAISHHMLTRTSHGKDQSQASDDNTNPWHNLTAFRLNQTARETLSFKLKSGEAFSVSVDTISKNSWNILLQERTYGITARLENGQVQYEIRPPENTSVSWHSARVINHEGKLWVYDADGESQLEFNTQDYNQLDEQQGSLKAPMNGTIIQVDSQAGQTVKAGDTLMIMEAMKMEHSIKAPEDGVIKEISFKVGDLVDEGALLLEMEEA